MAYYEIEIPLQGWDSDALEQALSDIGALSITLVDRGDEPVLEPALGEIRLWSDTLVRALFDAADAALRADAAARLAELTARFGDALAAKAVVRLIAEREWERVWMVDWKSMQFGRRLWVCPTNADAPTQPEAVVVWLDPGLAFGTGTHPTTAMCLEVLDRLTLTGRRIIDYGCGSGILGIAALKLGARETLAIDLDPQALLATRSNAERNDVSAMLATQGIDAPLAPADVVMANILAGPLIELRTTLKSACRIGGDLVLSGILATQVEAVQAVYRDAFAALDIVQRDDWCCIHARGAL